MSRLIWGFAGRTYHIVGNLMHWLKLWLISVPNDLFSMDFFYMLTQQILQVKFGIVFTCPSIYEIDHFFW